MSATFRHRLYEIMEQECPGDRAAKAFEVSLMVLIVANVIAVSAETLPRFREAPHPALQAFEIFSIAVFSIEYVARLYASAEKPGYPDATSARVSYLLSWPAVFDFVAIVPTLVTFGAVDLRFIRALRLLRIARVLKLGRYSEPIQDLLDVLAAKRDQLVSSLAVLGVLLFVASSLMYFAEHGAQPELYSSIPMAMWLTIATFGGNLEAPPVTLMGRVLAAAISILSAGLFALPAAILASGFSEKLEADRRAAEGLQAGTYDEDSSNQR